VGAIKSSDIVLDFLAIMRSGPILGKSDSSADILSAFRAG
jgi:hypothetical protein